MPKKLIEVALPLEVINQQAAREKSVRRGHPSTLHLWWARRPLAACRAVLFAQLVDDPSSHPDVFPTEEDQAQERARLFAIIEQLVDWDNAQNTELLREANAVIRSSAREPVTICDPFCGGGSIPLEAQRLGLEVAAADLNPVAVLITKAMVDLPARYGGRPPVHDRDERSALRTWEGAQGLSEDVRHYGEWMRAAASRELENSYPPVMLSGGVSAKLVACVWARTVKCANPACGGTFPLVRSFWLSRQRGELAYVVPVVDAVSRTCQYTVRTGAGEPPEGTVTRTGATCIYCHAPIGLDYVRAEGRAGRIGTELMALVGEHGRRRAYAEPTDLHRDAAAVEQPEDVPDTSLPRQGLGFRVQAYGMTRHAQLFTPRQLRALVTYSDLVARARDRVILDGAEPDYADAVATYLALGVSRLADIQNALCRWENTRAQVRNLFTRQTISMVWDFAEAGLFSDAAGDYRVSLGTIASALERLPATGTAQVSQHDAHSALDVPTGIVVATDPPYYDNVGYADLSDFFYVWLRRSLAQTYPSLFTTMLTPKDGELIADPDRYGGRAGARSYFERGFRETFTRLAPILADGYPMTVFYAFKQAEEDEASEDGSTLSASTGWETMLEGLIQAGFAVTGTWPMRTELGNRMRGQRSNALASSVVLVCRPRPVSAPITDRRSFMIALHSELPSALRELQRGSIAPVDLAQAAIGPGMGVFTRYSRVVDSDGSSLSVRTALALINQVLDEVLAEQEAEFDPDTRWAIGWFDQFGFDSGPYGTAETLSRARNTSIAGLVAAGLVSARAGKVFLLGRDELADGWSASTDRRFTVWEATLQLIKRLEAGGEVDAASLVQQLGGTAESARDLAYRLYSICERRGWARHALAFNALVTAWPELTRLAAIGRTAAVQGSLL